MAFKYKLSEMSKTASPEAAEKELGKPKSGFKVGDVSFSPDGTTKSTIYKIDDETGQISWRIEQLPGYDKLFDELDSLVDTAKRTANKSKDDQKFREFYEQIRQVRNQVRTHLRKFHPEIYRRIQLRMDENEVEEISTSAGAGSYLTKYAFKKPKKQQKLSEGTEEAITYFQQAIKLSHTNKVRNLILKAAKELGLEIPKVWTETVNENNKNPGATLGPGPKASEEGVKDNYYVKKFKYKLVPKDKNGNYVQKGSGLEVKNF